MNLVISHEPPPIPSRSWDWQVHCEGCEPGDPIGYGSTREEAITDLMEQLEGEGS